MIKPSKKKAAQAAKKATTTTPKAPKAAKAPSKRAQGRPPRAAGDSRKGQLAVPLDLGERADLDAYAKRVAKSSCEVVRIALRNMGVIRAVALSA